MKRLAEALSCVLMRGDVIALRGDLGAGKTTFCRYLITALLGRDEEIPSPTFSLLQTYDAPRFPVFHFDLYRLSDDSEATELGFDDAITDGLVLIEWPERIESLLPPTRLELHLSETGDPEERNVTLHGHGDWHVRLERFNNRQDFVESAGFGKAAQSHLQGDASSRTYARLGLEPTADRSNPLPAILMDWPAKADGPALRNGLPYSQIAHLAEDTTSFVAVARALRERGFSAPQIIAQDFGQGFIILEDLGDGVFGHEMSKGTPQETLYRAAIDCLIALRRAPPAADLPLPNGEIYRLPSYDDEALSVETELLIDWLWPALHGKEASPELRDEYLALWAPLFKRLQQDSGHWVLRDFHSPNLIWLPGRAPPANVGIIDFQDALRGPASYDLVSLLQDARLDVPAPLEQKLFNYYCAEAAKTVSEDESATSPPSPGSDFDAAEFRFSYAAMGAQRASKILGIFARLSARDGKPQYLQHMPRIWDYLERNLEHMDLAGLKTWFDTHFPPDLRKLDMAKT